jgi:DNA sulfur modification protein DndD
MYMAHLSIKNFRPFYGEHNFEFDRETVDKFTVIEAKADVGKTSLISAIVWALYGKEGEEEVHQKALPPFNSSMGFEMEDGDVDAVSVEFTLNDAKDGLPVYTIRRNMQVMKSGDSLTFPYGSVLEITEWEGHQSRPITDSQETQDVINSILPNDIQGFFLFEGEKLEKNFSFNNSDNVRSAIEQVSQIRQMTNAVEHLQGVRDEVYDIKKGEGDQQMKLNQSEISRLQGEMKDTEMNVKKSESSVAEALSRKEEINKILDNVNIPMIQQLNDRRKQLEESIETLESDLVGKKKDAVDNLLADAPLVLALKPIKGLLKQIEKLKEQDELPPKIKNIYLNELLKKKMCVCTRSLDPKDKDAAKAITCIKETLKKNDFSELAETMIQAKYVLETMRADLPKRITEERDRMVSACAGIENEIKKNKAEISNIDLKLKETDESQILALLEERKTFEAAITKQIESVARLKSANKIKESKMIELRQENDRLGKKQKDYVNKKKVADFMDRALNVLKELQQNILDEVRLKVQKTTFESFQKLHWDKANYKGFTIDGEYELSLEDKNGAERIYNISSGTKHVLLLSFISALIDVSGYRFPVFIDTPLANTDLEQRENIANVLPKYLSGNQVVLLMKDQEYTPLIRKILAPRVGKELRLIKTKDKTEVSKWK